MAKKTAMGKVGKTLLNVTRVAVLGAVAYSGWMGWVIARELRVRK